MLRVTVVALLVLALAAPAAAQDDGVWVSRGDFARLLGEAAAGRDLERAHALLKERLEIEQARSAALRDLLDLERQKGEKLRDLARIDEERAEHWKARVDEVQKEARAEARKAKVLAGCASGVALGSVAPPFGPLVGAAVGCAAGFFLP